VRPRRSPRAPSGRGLLRTSTQPTLNPLLLLLASVRTFTLNVSHTPISVECLFSTNLLPNFTDGESCSDVGQVLVINDPAAWESGSASIPNQPTGGLLRMAQRQKAPAFDTMYDNTSNTEISRSVTSSPMRYSGAFRSQQAWTDW